MKIFVKGSHSEKKASALHRNVWYTIYFTNQTTFSVALFLISPCGCSHDVWISEDTSFSTKSGNCLSCYNPHKQYYCKYIITYSHYPFLFPDPPLCSAFIQKKILTAFMKFNSMLSLFYLLNHLQSLLYSQFLTVSIKTCKSNMWWSTKWVKLFS